MLTVSEAAAMGVPQFVEYGAATMPQERRNAEWVQATGVGGGLGSWREAPRAIERAVRDPELREYRRNLSRQRNTAPEEVPDMLAEILSR